MTVLKAQVHPDRVADLERAYREATAQLPPGIAETFLARDARGSSSFEIVTVWTSQAELDAVRASGVTPKGVQIFQSVGASPELSILEVVAHGHR